MLHNLYLNGTKPSSQGKSLIKGNQVVSLTMKFDFQIDNNMGSWITRLTFEYKNNKCEWKRAFWGLGTKIMSFHMIAWPDTTIITSWDTPAKLANMHSRRAPGNKIRRLEECLAYQFNGAHVCNTVKGVVGPLIKWLSMQKFGNLKIAGLIGDTRSASASPRNSSNGPLSLFTVWRPSWFIQNLNPVVNVLGVEWDLLFRTAGN